MVGTRMVLFGIVAVAVLGLIIMGLWNALLPPILRLPEINFWQALGLFVLSRIFFGHFGGRRKPRFARGWDSLTPDERQRFRHAMGDGEKL